MQGCFGPLRVDIAPVKVRLGLVLLSPSLSAPLALVGGIVGGVIVLVDPGAYHVGPLPRLDALAEMEEHAPHGGPVALGDHIGLHRLAVAGQLGQGGDVQITEPGHGSGAGYRGGCHDQKVG